MNKRWWPFGLALAVFLLDQASKWWVVRNFEYGEDLPVFPPVFFLTRVHNTGGLFGFLATHDTWYRLLLLTGLPLITVGVLVFILYRYPLERTWGRLALGLLLGGACGNLLDRLRFSYVVDFFDFFFGDYHYPTFNLADCAILMGIIGLLWDDFRRPKKKDEEEGDASPAPEMSKNEDR